MRKVKAQDDVTGEDSTVWGQQTSRPQDHFHISASHFPGGWSSPTALMNRLYTPEQGWEKPACMVKASGEESPLL